MIVDGNVSYLDCCCENKGLAHCFLRLFCLDLTRPERIVSPFGKQTTSNWPIPESDDDAGRSSYKTDELSEPVLFKRVREFERERGLGNGNGCLSRFSMGKRTELNVE